MDSSDYPLLLEPLSMLCLSNDIPFKRGLVWYRLYTTSYVGVGVQSLLVPRCIEEEAYGICWRQRDRREVESWMVLRVVFLVKKRLKHRNSE